MGRPRAGRVAPPPQRIGVLARLGVLVLAAGCHRPPYPAVEAPAAQPLAHAPEVSRDPGDEAAIRALEQQCRVRMSGETAEASLEALDRVREVVGAGCDLETVGGDPLAWLLRCRSDALFKSGRYQLSEERASCAELGGARVGSWECFGAVLSSLLSTDDGGALAGLSLAVLGHVDDQPLKPGSDSHLCTELHERLGYHAEVAWEPVAEDAEEEERRYANHQLAFCRAASVAERVEEGLTRRSQRKPASAAADAGAGDGDGIEVAVLGMGTAWLAAQPQGRCPSHGLPREERPECPEARRVDLLVRFTPRLDRLERGCDEAGGTAGALHCLQRCMERAAAGTTRGSPAANVGGVELFEAGTQSTALPVGWYLHRMPERPERRLSLTRVCETLSIPADHCRTR